jgi:hypothetical protein
MNRSALWKQSAWLEEKPLAEARGKVAGSSSLGIFYRSASIHVHLSKASVSDPSSSHELPIQTLPANALCSAGVVSTVHALDVGSDCVYSICSSFKTSSLRVLRAFESLTFKSYELILSVAQEFVSKVHAFIPIPLMSTLFVGSPRV